MSVKLDEILTHYSTKNEEEMPQKTISYSSTIKI